LFIQDSGAVGLCRSVVPQSDLDVQICVGKNHYFGWYILQKIEKIEKQSEKFGILMTAICLCYKAGPCRNRV